VGSGGGVVVGSAGGGGGACVVGGAGGGFGAVLVFVGFGTDGLLVVVRGVGGAALAVGSAGVDLALRLGVAWGVVRPARDTAGGFRLAGAGLTDPAGCTPAAGFWAGVAFAIAAARAPVAITDPAATPFVTSDSRRSARSRWWAGGEAIESLSARTTPLPSPRDRPRPHGRPGAALTRRTGPQRRLPRAPGTAKPPVPAVRGSLYQGTITMASGITVRLQTTTPRRQATGRQDQAVAASPLSR
jgi:hypothetical protein